MVRLRDYQQRISDQAMDILKGSGLVYLAMECRTGKTITAMSVAQKYGAKSVLVVSKIKAIPSIKADYEALRPSFKLDVVNYESAKKAKGKYDLVILDEAHTLGAFPKPSKRTERSGMPNPPKTPIATRKRRSRSCALMQKPN